MGTVRQNRPKILIIVQNLPVPLDRRVWLECQALSAQGFSVAVICPKGPGDPGFEIIDDIAIYKYAPAPQAQGLLSYIVEFSYSWTMTAKLSLKVRRERGFDVIQACNPPDTYWLLAWLWRWRGVRFVFDQHDLNPELFLSRFGHPHTLAARLQYGGLLWLERRTYAVADHVISTNESYRRIALRRGNKKPGSVTVVRSGPNTKAMRPIYPPESARAGAKHLLVYLGIMGPQDGVDQALDVVHELVHRRGRTGVHAVLMGFGDCLEDLKRQATRLNLNDYVTFTGRVGPDTIAEYLSAADIGLGPDQKTPLNDLSTMNKTMEYMAYALPTVSFDLTETRISGGEAALYVPSGDISAFADEIEKLMDDPALRVALGMAARERVAAELDWHPQARAYVGVYDTLLGLAPDNERRAAWPMVDSPDRANNDPDISYVDLEDRAELERFIAERTGASDFPVA